MESGRKQKNFTQGKIYKIVNSVNDKIYVGSTCSKLCKRMVAHRSCANSKRDKDTKFYKSMNEIGVENFKIILIKDYPCDNYAQLLAEEYKTMKELIENGEELYNDFIGVMSEEQREKISKSLKGEKNPNFGKKLSDETKKRMSEAHKGEKSHMFGKTGKHNPKFRYGCINYNKSGNRWRFTWYENGKKTSKSFSIKKYGGWAKILAEEYRKKIYPESVDESQYVEIIFVDNNDDD